MLVASPRVITLSSLDGRRCISITCRAECNAASLLQGAKKMMSLVSRRIDGDSSASSSSLSLKAKTNRNKLSRPEISSPMDMPAHPIISRAPEEKASDHQVIKRRLRSRLFPPLPVEKWEKLSLSETPAWLVLAVDGC
ncbi:hypothetical protein EYF80_042467 [Liparis tanakae]|uniref:Uncharacterized protein n=1 Tax=Liparis tanakae TaxID=230148 RepID=A0A4Z2G2H4_9TELE|nr:hypothetical protein EYF80_042467 [Liparis tanakae]